MSGAPKGSLMSNSGFSPEAPIGGKKPSTFKTCVVSTHRRTQTNWVSGRMLQPTTEPVIANFLVKSGFIVGRPG